MKKILITLSIITAGIAILFAQTPEESAPAAAQKSVRAPAPVPERTAQPAASPEKPSLSSPAGTAADLSMDEVRLSDDLAGNALLADNRISLTLKNADLDEVIEIFSRLSKANIIVPDLSGDKKINREMDVSLDHVEWKPALEAILESQNLELYEKVPGSKVYSIREKTPGAPEATHMKIFKLDYASVTSVTNLLAGMVGATGSYSVFPERNVVIAQATAKILQNIGETIQQIDLPRQQVFIEAKFLELNDKAQRDLGINWQVLQAYGVGVSGIGGNYAYKDSKTDTITKSRKSTINNQSGENRFRDIEGKPYEALTKEPSGGAIEWPERPGNDPSNVRILNLTPTTFSENLSTFASEAGSSALDVSTVTRALGATLSASDFNLVLSALEQKDGVDIVSNPKIIVANEEEAFIHIGDKEPNILIERTAGTQNDPGGQLSVKLDDKVPYFEDGVKVVVKPTINTASNITVRITPEITRFVDRKAVTTSDGITLIDFPISRTKKIDTVFSLESGQTAAIGGLTQISDTIKENKIPWLGSIPFLGRLFSYEQKIQEQNETIIFVTVGLANPASIDMNTGLPEDTRLTQRYQIRDGADRQVSREELNVLRSKENAEMEKELERLRAANKKLLEKQKKNTPDEEVVGTLSFAPVADLSLLAKAETPPKAEEGIAPVDVPVSAPAQPESVEDIFQTLEAQDSGGGIYSGVSAETM